MDWGRTGKHGKQVAELIVVALYPVYLPPHAGVRWLVLQGTYPGNVVLPAFYASVSDRAGRIFLHTKPA